MGTKRKIEIEKRETPKQRSVACSKRRRTVFKKATELCLLAGANVAVFLTSPAENSDIVYSFSGYSPASEVAECFLNGKLPPPPKIIKDKLGFYWEDPDLYTYCDGVTELNIIEDRLLRLKKDVTECLIKKEKGNQFFSFDPSFNPSNVDEIRGESCSQIVSFDQQNPSSSSQQSHGGISSQFYLEQGPNSSSSDESLLQIATLDQNPCFFIQDESSSFFENNSITLTQETQEEPMMIYLSGYDEESSFWDNLFFEDNSNPQINTTNEEDYMIDISDYFSEEDKLQF